MFPLKDNLGGEDYVSKRAFFIIIICFQGPREKDWPLEKVDNWILQRKRKCVIWYIFLFVNNLYDTRAKTGSSATELRKKCFEDEVSIAGNIRGSTQFAKD